MNQIKVDLNETCGKIKALNAVNNGPVSSVRGVGTEEIFKELNIPFSRLHDASFYASYGGEFTVDVHRIFRDFGADENKEESYFFEATDNYLKNINSVGTKIFYRLGATIEHGVKFGTFPPKDYLKWARICEHIIRHYNEGWANGFHYNIEYWEIWNEPDCRNADGSNPCWQGSEEQFIEFYNVAAKHLKSAFPLLKIGGPAFCNIWNDLFVKKFLQNVKDNNVPLDFFSYHWYGKRVSDFEETIVKAHNMLNEYGLGKVEKILNEWNYVDGWLGEDFKSSIRTIIGQKGASFVCAAMCAAQKLDVDMLMYYDARPCAFCGLYSSYTFDKYRTFNTFFYFNELVKLTTSIKTETFGDGIYACTAKDEENIKLMFTYFPDEKNKGDKQITLSFVNVPKKFTCIKVFVTDENSENHLVKEMPINGEKASLQIDIKKYDVGFICFY